MEKIPPPPYSEINAYPPPGFNPQHGYQLPNVLPQMNQKPTGNPTVMVSTPTVVPMLGPESLMITCPHCHHHVSTRVESEPATKTHLFALVLCLFGCVPCCLIPYCTDSCQNRTHYCPSCAAFLGAYTN